MILHVGFNLVSFPLLSAATSGFPSNKLHLVEILILAVLSFPSFRVIRDADIYNLISLL